MPEQHLNHRDLTETEGAPGVRANVIPFLEPEPDMASQASHPRQDCEENGRDRADEA